MRCSSEDSFIVRQDHRSKVKVRLLSNCLKDVIISQLENEELREFEMLEEAANMSFSSQLSLFNDLPKHDLTKHTPFRALIANTRHDKNEAKNLTKAHHTFIPESCVEKSPVPEKDGIDLDETLKFSPSLAKGVEFNDEEAWESFNHGSPQSRHRAESSGSDLTVQSPSNQGDACKSSLSQFGGAWKSPVRKEFLEENVSPLHTALQDKTNVLHGRVTSEGSRIAAVEKSRITEPSHVNSGTAKLADIPAEPARFADYQYPAKPDSPESLYDSLPPPSALVSKLFPALRQADEQPKGLFRNGQVRPHHTSEEDAPPTKSPSPISSMEGDSGIRSLSSTSVALSEDMKYKLNQLEEEIVKYRSENVSLEKLRKEREEVRCTCCKYC